MIRINVHNTATVIFYLPESVIQYLRDNEIKIIGEVKGELIEIDKTENPENLIEILASQNIQASIVNFCN